MWSSNKDKFPKSFYLYKDKEKVAVCTEKSQNLTTNEQCLYVVNHIEGTQNRFVIEDAAFCTQAVLKYDKEIICKAGQTIKRAIYGTMRTLYVEYIMVNVENNKGTIYIILTPEFLWWRRIKYIFRNIIKKVINKSNKGE